jgi:hypothetical protein
VAAKNIWRLDFGVPFRRRENKAAGDAEYEGLRFEVWGDVKPGTAAEQQMPKQEPGKWNRVNGKKVEAIGIRVGACHLGVAPLPARQRPASA